MLPSKRRRHPQHLLVRSRRERNAVEGLSMVKPPCGVMSAIDLRRGELKWQVPHGVHQTSSVTMQLKGINIPKTGQGGGVGVLVTKTLVIAGDPLVTTTPNHPRGAMMRAYNKETGEEVGAVWMPAQVSGSPMTYRIGGRQFIVIAVSGGNYSGEYRVRVAGVGSSRYGRRRDAAVRDARRRAALSAIVIACVMFVVVAFAQSAGSSVWDGVFTDEQVKRGAVSYQRVFELSRSGARRAT